MKHQITNLFMAILVFAGIATSAIRADEIEGTWSQDGQYKKFSKNYSSISFKDFSRDNKKLAVMENNCLRIIDLLSGKILDTFNINPEISIISFAISKDFKYLSTVSDRITNESDSRIFSINFKVYNLANHGIMLDSVITYNFSEIMALNGINNPELIFEYDIVNLKILYTYSYGYQQDGSGSIEHSYDCDNNFLSKHESSVPTNSNSKIFYSYSKPFHISYNLTNYITGNGGQYYSHYSEWLSKITKNSSNIIFSRDWYKSNIPSDPGSNIYPMTPIGITADNKKFVLIGDNDQLILYSLDSANKFTILTDNKGNTKFPEFTSSTVLFPNDKVGKSILLLKPLANNLLLNKLNYETGEFQAIASVDKDYITTAKAKFIIDSNKIMSIDESGELYLLEINTESSNSVAEYFHSTVFPNPASNSITIEYPLSSQASVSIVNESGRVYSAEIKSINAESFTIETSLLPNGIYFVQIQDRDINKSVKFVVKR